MKKLLLVLPLALGVLALVPSEEPYDLLITGGRVVDGTGAPWFVADVGVRGGKIVDVGPLAGRPAKRTVDARGLYVSPGFIDLLGQSEYNVLVDKRAASKITQGITTEVTGEGSSIAPLNDAMLADSKDIYQRYGFTPDFRTLGGYFDTFQRRGSAINLGTFVGAGTVRAFVIGNADRRATPQELAKMEATVDQAMREGALGVSSSLQYVPDMYNSTDELIAMAKVAAKYGGAYFTHQRSEANAIDSSLDEVFRISKEAGIRSQIWHLKTAYKKNWGRMPAVLQRIADARAQGIDVAANQYPYTAGSNGLDACLPPWIREGGREALLKRLADPKQREKAKADMLVDSDEWSNQYLGSGGPSRVLIASVVNPALKKFEGKTVEQMGIDEKKDPRDALIDLVIADRSNTACIIFMMDEEDVKAGLRSPLVAFCTDSGAGATDGIFSEEKSHPRGWASTARILGHYVRDEKVLRLEEAVRKMTSFPAEGAGLKDRGVVKVGFPADLVVFDLAKVQDIATYEEPRRYSAGMPYVAVNGVLVVDGGKITNAAPGQVLWGPGKR
ncbi:MAG TPA: D-aminoacylase [Thermoanaerobaculia bacterium]|jgi:dihydroorotase/N-acyl-D-amino-acid deacylase|nr:D-aminoacylase [Thermoanaerobaculia bacterium]